MTRDGIAGPTRTPASQAAAANAEELVRRFAGPLSAKSWPQRLSALKEMHDQLVEDIHDFDLFCEVFPRLIEGLVRTFGAPAIESLEQAQVYANSADRGHREAAGAWMKEYYRTRRANEN